MEMMDRAQARSALSSVFLCFLLLACSAQEFNRPINPDWPIPSPQGFTILYQGECSSADKGNAGWVLIDVASEQSEQAAAVSLAAAAQWVDQYQPPLDICGSEGRTFEELVDAGNAMVLNYYTCREAKADGEDAKVKLGFAIMCTANTTTTVVTSEVVAVVDAVVDIANLDSGTSMVPRSVVCSHFNKNSFSCFFEEYSFGCDIVSASLRYGQFLTLETSCELTNLLTLEEYNLECPARYHDTRGLTLDPTCDDLLWLKINMPQLFDSYIYPLVRRNWGSLPRSQDDFSEMLEASASST